MVWPLLGKALTSNLAKSAGMAALGYGLGKYGDDLLQPASQPEQQPQQPPQQPSAIASIMLPKASQAPAPALQFNQPSFRDATAQLGIKSLNDANKALTPHPDTPISNLAPMMARDPQYAEARRLLLDQIRSGLTTNEVGKRLTVDGLNALTNQLKALDDAEQAQYASQLQYGSNRANTATSALNALTTSDTYMRNFEQRAMQDFMAAPENIVDPAQIQQWQQRRAGSWMLAQQLHNRPDAVATLQNQVTEIYRALPTANASVKPRMLQDLSRYEDTLRAYFIQQQYKSPQLRPWQVLQQPAQQYADGGVVAAPQLAAIQQYQSYAQMMQRMGLQPVPFEAFLAAAMQNAPQMQPQATPNHRAVMGYANGGVVSALNDASGKLLIDPSPDAERDSIPAVIDNAHPARLDSGEMVLPREVVAFYGIDRLQKMIDKVRQSAQR